MSIRNNDKRDPVCGMTVDADKYAIEYLQMHFAFCSLQCKERFLANPRLYIGKPGHRARKQDGEVVMKKRRLKLQTEPDAETASLIITVSQAMMGIENIEIDGKYINVTYDLLQATEAQIETEITRAGTVLGNDWAERLRRSFVDFVEEWQIESIAGSSGSSGHHH